MLLQPENRIPLARAIKERLEEVNLKARLWERYSQENLAYMIRVYIKDLQSYDHGYVGISNYGNYVNCCFTERRAAIQMVIDDFNREGI